MSNPARAFGCNPTNSGRTRLVNQEKVLTNSTHARINKVNLNIGENTENNFGGIGSFYKLKCTYGGWSNMGSSTTSKSIIGDVSDNKCPRCTIHIKMMGHLFYSCLIARQRWRGMLQLVQQTSFKAMYRDIMFGSIAIAVKQNKRKPRGANLHHWSLLYHLWWLQ